MVACHTSLAAADGGLCADRHKQTVRESPGAFSANARKAPLLMSDINGITGKSVQPMSASKAVRKILIELMSATTFGAERLA